MSQTQSDPSTPQTHTSRFDQPGLYLPQEIITKIYTRYLRGVRLVPRVRDQNGDLLMRYSGSYLLVADRSSYVDLLLLNKSQKTEVEYALWKCATVILDNPINMAALVLGRNNCHNIRAIEIGWDWDHPMALGEFAPYKVLRSKVLRSLPNVRLITITLTCPFVSRSLRFRHPTLDAELNDPFSELKQCLKCIRCDLLDPRSFRSFRRGEVVAWQTTPEVVIKFGLISNEGPASVKYPATVPKPIERFRVPVSFSTRTWFVTGMHNNQRFSIAQDPLPNQPAIPQRELTTENQEHHEQRCWALVDEYFSNLTLNPKIVAALYEAMNGPPLADLELAFRVGATILHTYDESVQHPGSVVATFDLENDARHELWRRLLRVDRRVTEEAETIGGPSGGDCR